MGAFLLPCVASTAVAPAPNELLDTYCSRCHNDERLSGNLTFSNLSPHDLETGANLEQWEKILRMTTRGEMPPRSRPQPGRATLRRLNRAEYANAVRDLLAIDVDVAGELPADDSGYGFDNIADV